jgi:hypothetical protein
MAANGDARGGGVPRPTNPMVTPLLTDLYHHGLRLFFLSQLSQAAADVLVGEVLERRRLGPGAKLPRPARGRGGEGPGGREREGEAVDPYGSWPWRSR